MKILLTLGLWVFISIEIYAQDKIFLNGNAEMLVKIIEEQRDQLSFYDLKDSARVVKTIAKSAIAGYQIQEWKLKSILADSSALPDIIAFKKDGVVRFCGTKYLLSER